MTTYDRTLRWIVYGAALLILFGLEQLVFSRLPIFGVIPAFLPLALAAAATLEESRFGAAFGMVTGMLLTVSGSGFWVIPLCAAAGFGLGLLTRYALRQDFVGHFLGCTALLLIRTVWCVGSRFVAGIAPFPILLQVALPEFVYSLVFAWPVYLFFRFLCRHWGRIYYQ